MWNLILSALTAGVSAFALVAFVDGVPTKASVLAGLSAGLAAAIQHIRQSPVAPKPQA